MAIEITRYAAGAELEEGGAAAERGVGDQDGGEDLVGAALGRGARR